MITEETFRGLSRYEAVSGDVTLKARQPRLRTIVPSVSGLKVTLPDATLLRIGGPQFYLVNLSATESFSVRDPGDSEIGVVDVDQIGIVWLAGNIEANGTWTVDVRDLIGTAAGA